MSAADNQIDSVGSGKSSWTKHSKSPDQQLNDAINDRIKDTDFKNDYTKLAIEGMNNRFCKQYKNFIAFSNIILAEGPDSGVKDLFTLPLIRDS